jgi:hypothetical protein
VEIIEALGFGVIERLLIRGGLPCYEPEPRIVQTIKLASEPERQPDRTYAGVPVDRDLNPKQQDARRIRHDGPAPFYGSRKKAS